MPDLVAIILTYNEEEHIVACIESLKWVERIVVFDSFSTDATCQIAEAAGAEVIQHPFANFGDQRNAALDAVTEEWVLFIDADERVSHESRDEMLSKLASKEAASLRGWWLPRHNYIFGKLTLGAGWYPDHQLRLVHRLSAHYDPGRPVHEEVILEGDAGYLEHPLIHYNYSSVRQFHEKQRKYSRFEAKLRYEAGERSNIRRSISMPLRQFWWRFVTLKGYSDGFHGLRLSVFMAWYEFRTWRLVAQLAQSSG